MKKFLIGAVVVVIVLIALVVPAIIPVDTYKGELLARIKDVTGRRARIDGDFSLSVLPSLAFSAGKVSLANAPGSRHRDMVTLERLNVRIKLWPLFGGNVAIESFVLEKPVIRLEVDRKGRPNWQFKQAAPAGRKAPTAKRETASPGTGGEGIGLAGLALGDVRLIDGHITYADARTGTSHAVEAINMKVALPSLSSPMTADGSLVWNREKIELALRLADPNAFLGGGATAAGPGPMSTPGSSSTSSTSTPTCRRSGGPRPPRRNRVRPPAARSPPSPPDGATSRSTSARYARPTPTSTSPSAG